MMPTTTSVTTPSGVAPSREDQRRARYLELKAEVHRKLLARLNLETLATTDRTRAESEIRSLTSSLIAETHAPLTMGEREAILGDVLDEVFGFGPLEPLLRDDSINDILVNMLSEIIVHKLERDSVFLWTLPLFHCNGWCFPWAVTGAGGTHVMLRAVAPARILELIREHGVTHFNGAPSVLLMLAEAPEARGVRFDPPIRVATGGSPPSPTLLARMQDLGVQVTHLYGLTETYGPHVYCQLQPEWEGLPVEQKAAVMARQGVPYPVATHVRVVDPEMRDVPADAETLGEVVMRGNNVMRGYYADPEATAEAFRGGTPGDTGEAATGLRRLSGQLQRGPAPRGVGASATGQVVPAVGASLSHQSGVPGIRG